MLALMKAFTFLARKNHENLSNKIVTKPFRRTFPIISNKAFGYLDEYIIKTKHIKNKEFQTHKNTFHGFLVKPSRGECKMKFFHQLGKQKICTVPN